MTRKVEKVVVDVFQVVWVFMASPGPVALAWPGLWMCISRGAKFGSRRHPGRGLWASRGPERVCPIVPPSAQLRPSRKGGRPAKMAAFPAQMKSPRQTVLMKFTSTKSQHGTLKKATVLTLDKWGMIDGFGRGIRNRHLTLCSVEFP